MRHFKKSLMGERTKNYTVLSGGSKGEDVEEKVIDDTMVVQDISTSHLQIKSEEDPIFQD
jgi:hypothetical protein